ncbi:hypothetical protein TWF191_001778 [Orbilia oligospora]|uniref:Uncharacterized protein n=2 Tax=Orbilia oligospora TaxID=2813651 RepID=A0A7C8QC77_ORBOL|nr:hypothetical protein TWF191_001778 [Orbilia oligospora]
MPKVISKEIGTELSTNFVSMQFNRNQHERCEAMYANTEVEEAEEAKEAEEGEEKGEGEGEDDEDEDECSTNDN